MSPGRRRRPTRAAGARHGHTWRLRLWHAAHEVGTSFWAIPSLCAGIGVLAGLGLVAVDGAVGAEWVRSIGWLAGNQPDGARAVLSTVAGSTITVAGVVFSVTLAAITYAAG